MGSHIYTILESNLSNDLLTIDLLTINYNKTYNKIIRMSRKGFLGISLRFKQ